MALEEGVEGVWKAIFEIGRSKILQYRSLREEDPHWHTPHTVGAVPISGRHTGWIGGGRSGMESPCP